MTEKRFGMYQNTLYDDGDILNPFNAMKLLNHFDKENAKLKEENEQLKEENKELKSNVIDLIDKKINKLKNINEVSLIPRESVEILKELKKEVKE